MLTSYSVGLVEFLLTSLSMIAPEMIGLKIEIIWPKKLAHANRVPKKI